MLSREQFERTQHLRVLSTVQRGEQDFEAAEVERRKVAACLDTALAKSAPEYVEVGLAQRKRNEEPARSENRKGDT
jgi:hypothetical protein